MSKFLYPNAGTNVARYYHTEAADLLTRGLPVWCPDRTDNTTATRVLANLIGIRHQDIVDYTNYVASKRILPLTPPSKFISDSYICGESEDVENDTMSTVSVDTIVSGIVTTSGVISTSGDIVVSGQLAHDVVIYKAVDTDIYKYGDETDLYVSAVKVLPVSGSMFGEYLNSKLEVIQNASSHITFELPYDINPIVSHTKTDLSFEVKETELTETVTEDVTITAGNKYVLMKNIPIGNTIEVIPTYLSGVIPSYTRYSVIDKLDKTLDFISACDFNKNDIIDEGDVAEVQRRLGTSIGSVGVDIWERDYADYDINKDGIIDNIDLNIITSRFMVTVKPAVVLRIEDAGDYSVTYETTGTEAVVGSLTVVNGSIEYNHNLSTDYVSNILDEDISDITFHPKTRLYYAANNTTRSITVYQLNNGELLDRMDIPLNIVSLDIELLGITSYGNYIYVLLYHDGEYSVLRVDVTLTNPMLTMLLMDIYSGRTYNGCISRFKYELQNPSGIFASDDYLYIIDNDKLVTLGRIFDYYYPDLENNIIFFREKYDYVTINDTNFSQVYFFIWNVFDEYGYKVGVPRLPGETNQSYKRRLLTMYTHPHSETMQGSLNGIMRELDEEFQDITKQYNVWLENEVVDVSKDTFRIYIDGILLPYSYVETDVKTDIRDNAIYQIYIFYDDLDRIIFRIDYDTLSFDPQYAKSLFSVPNINTYDVTVEFTTVTATGDTIATKIYRPLTFNAISTSGVLRIDRLTDDVFLKDPDNGYYYADGRPTPLLISLITELNTQYKIKWYNFATDSDLMYQEKNDSNIVLVKPTFYDAEGMHYTYGVNGVGDNNSLMVVSAVKNELGNNIIYSDFIKDQDIYSDITLPYVNKLEQIHPVLTPGFVYHNHDEIYCYANKTTEIVLSGIVYGVSGLAWNSYPLSSHPRNFSPILVCDDINDVGISGIVDASMFYLGRFPSSVLYPSGNILLKQSDLKLSAFEGADRFNPSERFAQTTSSQPYKRSVVSVNDIVSLAELDSSEHPNVYVKSCNSVMSTISGIVKVEYETGGTRFVEEAIDINPITNEMHQLILCLTPGGETPQSAAVETTKHEVIGNEIDYSDIVVTAYDINGVPISGVMVSGWINRRYVDDGDHNIYLSGIISKTHNGHFYEDVIDLSTNPITNKYILSQKGNTFGYMYRGCTHYQIPSMGTIDNDVGITGYDGSYVIRYTSPFNFNRTFDVDITVKISGITSTTTSSVRVYPINKTGIDRSLVGDNVPNIGRRFNYMTVLDTSGSVSLGAYPFGGPTNVVAYDADEYFTYNRKKTPTKVEPVTYATGLLLNNALFDSRYITGMDQSGVIATCFFKDQLTSGNYVISYMEQETDRDIVNMGDVLHE